MSRGRKYRLTDEQRQRVADNVHLASYLIRHDRLGYGLRRGESAYEDALSEAHLGLCNAASKYNPDAPVCCKFSSFAGYAVKSRLDSMRTSNARKPPHEQLDGEAALLLGLTTAPEDVGHDLRLDVRAAVARMARRWPDDAHLITRHYLDGLSFALLRAELGISRQLLSYRLSQARKRLAPFIPQEYRP